MELEIGPPLLPRRVLITHIESQWLTQKPLSSALIASWGIARALCDTKWTRKFKSFSLFVFVYSKSLSASVWSVLKEHQSSPTVINHSFLVAPNDLCSSTISLTVTFMHLASAKNVERSRRLKKTFGFDEKKLSKATAVVLLVLFTQINIQTVAQRHSSCVRFMCVNDSTFET